MYVWHDDVCVIWLMYMWHGWCMCDMGDAGAFEALVRLFTKHCMTFLHVCVHVFECVCVCECVGWPRLVGSLKLQVSFAEHSLFYKALLQKKPVGFRSLLIIATPYVFCASNEFEWMICASNAALALFTTHCATWLMYVRRDSSMCDVTDVQEIYVCRCA